MHDIVIKNGKIFDGTDTTPYYVDVAIDGDTIVRIGAIEAEAKKVIDAGGKIVTPGFVDIHCHSDAIVFHDEKNPLRLRQGFTTEVIGNCGISAAPVNPENLPLLSRYCNPFYSNVPVPYNWQSYGEFLDEVEKHQPMLNTAGLVGHGTLRIAISGFDARPLTEEELKRMGDLLKESMELVEAVREIIDVAEETGVNVEISHHKSQGIRNKGKTKETLRLIREANAGGCHVNCDVYPYDAASTQFSACLPPWAMEGGVEKLIERLSDEETRKKIIEELKNENPTYESFYQYAGSWDRVLINECSIKDYEGKTVQKIADENRADPYEMALDIIKNSGNNVMMIVFTMSEEDITRVLYDDNAIVCTDGFPGLGPYHPRYTSAFVRVLEKYVKNENILSLQSAIHKMTGLPAEKIGLKDRGHIAEGMKADVLVIDFEKIRDNADYQNYNAVAEGINFVIINGEVAVDDDHFHPICAGRVLRNGR